MKLLVVEDEETLCIGDLLLFKTEEGRSLITQIKDFSIGEIILEIVGGRVDLMEIEEIY